MNPILNFIAAMLHKEMPPVLDIGRSRGRRSRRTWTTRQIIITGRAHRRQFHLVEG